MRNRTNEFGLAISGGGGGAGGRPEASVPPLPAWAVRPPASVPACRSPPGRRASRPPLVTAAFLLSYPAASGFKPKSTQPLFTSKKRDGRKKGISNWKKRKRVFKEISKRTSEKE